MEGYQRNRHYLVSMLEQLNVKLIFLQEIWLAASDQKMLKDEIPEYNFSIATPDMFEDAEDLILYPAHVWHGAAIAWHRDLHNSVTELVTTHSRFTGIILSIGSTSKILCISLYAPTSGKDEEFLECLGFLEDFIVANTPITGSVLIGADSNCSQKSSARRQLAWQEFCCKLSLVITSSNLPTFHHHNGTSESKIDYFLSSNCKLDNVRQYCTLETPLNFSSHDPLIVSANILSDEQSEPEKFSNTYTPFHQKRVIWRDCRLPAYKEATNTALAEALEFWDFAEAIPHLCSLFSNLLVTAAEKTMEIVEPVPKGPKRFQKSIRRIEIAKRRLKNSFQRWKKAGKPRNKSDPLHSSYLSAKAGGHPGSPETL